jgi:hypothetical protein
VVFFYFKMDQNFQQCRRRTGREINDSVASGMPSRRSFKAAYALQICMVANAP